MAALGAGHPALAAITDVAQVPLSSAVSTVVKPNLMFILDDSGSMDRDYMPDDANFAKSKYGFYASQCNGLAYNPAITYALPVDSTGAPRAAGTFTFPSPTALPNPRTVTSPAAPSMVTGSVTVTLSSGTSGSYSTGAIVTLYSNDDTSRLMVGTVTSWNSTTRVLGVNVTSTSGSGTLTNPRIGDGDNRPFFYTYSGSQTKLTYSYDSSSTLITSTTFYRECDSNEGSTPGSSVFAKFVVTPSYPALQNYANWHTYYRTRLLMMQSATSLAFTSINDRYRVGFTTISSKSVSGANFLDAADFDTSQKGKFYTALSNASASDYSPKYTPLRGALSKAGKYFAKKATGQTYDPMQYSCQRNYAILTTDGYWNTNNEINSTDSTSYGPDKLDNTDVGQQDGGSTPRPMKDGETSTLQQRTSTLQTQTITPRWTKGTSQLQTWSITPQWTTSTSQLQKRTVTPQWTTGTSTLQKLTGQLQSRTSSNSGFSWGSWGNVSSCTWDTFGTTQTQCQYVWGTPSNASSCTVSYSTTTSSGTTWTGNGTKCQYSTPVNTTTASCTPVTASPGPTNYTVGTAVTCTDATVYGSWTNTASCTTSSTLGCQYSTPVNTTTTSCTPVAASPGSPYTVGTAVTCTALAPVLGTKSNVSTCTASSTVGCGYSSPVNSTVTTCTAVPASTGPTDYTVGTAVTCTTTTPLYGSWSNTSSCTASATTGCQYTSWTSWSNVGSCTATPQSAGPTYTVGTAKECQTVIVSSGSSNSLADVAMYYYQTDLRTSALGNCTATVNGNAIDVCANNVSPSGADDATHQHMTTFTLGLGVSGTLRYQQDYLTAASGDFHDIVQGTKNWPNPTADEATAVDDLWHAAVDGRGRYFSAGDPLSLAQSLSSTLLSIDAKSAYGSAAASSTLQPVAGDNSLFLAKYKTVYWVGDLVSYSIDPVTGVISAPVWSAAAKLQATAPDSRNIYYFKRNTGANTGALRSFTYANLTADGLNGLFDGACSKSPALTQCSTSGYSTATANSGANMVSYLRGGSNAVYRPRFAGDADIGGGILGDVIGGAPVYVRRPPFKYTENDYAGFVASIDASHGGAGRPGVIYVASNDGMLHAIDGATGNEKWAYIPSMVMDRMYRLADSDYANRHEYFVNGAPVVGDIYVSGSGWKTILVGGLGAGGRGYYALDITDPDSPKALWEFTNDSVGGNSNLGLTFGNPVITKRADGTWVVAFSSGYNNVSPGDGNGHLFVVNANTGARILDIGTFTTGTTPAGTTTTPSGLSKINAWVDSEIDNTAKRFYGGDLLGNLWRFDVDNLVAPNQAALRLAYFAAGGQAQPVTTKPELAEVNYAGSRYPVVYVGTGKYLGTTDLGNTATQTIYAIKDPLTNTPLGDVHASSSVIAQTMSEASANAPRTITELPVNWASDNGWRVDLLTPGERVNVDVQLVFNTLTVASNIPSTDVCSAGGNSYLYQLDIGNGSSRSSFGTTVSGAKIAGSWLGGSMIVGLSWITLQLPGQSAGSGSTYTLPVDNVTGFRLPTEIPPADPPQPTGRRTSWRELVE